MKLRPYQPGDEDAAIELWRRTWQQAYPKIDFAARVAWWRNRWRGELVPKARIMVAEQDRAGDTAHETPALAGFVTIDPATGYLDQIVVAPEAWGTPLAKLLLEAAQQVSPRCVTLHVNRDNARAIAFYQRQGFTITGEDTNPLSGAAIYRMEWPPKT